MTLPPAASIRAAAAITSITMNGGTSLRADGVMMARAESSIMRRSPQRFDGAPTACPAVAAFDRSLQACAQGNEQPDVILVALTLLGGATRLAEHLGSDPHGHD